MILPEKHLAVEESLFGFGGFLLSLLVEETTVDNLWAEYITAYKSKTYTVSFSFDKFILTIDYLFLIDAIRINERGELARAVG